MAKDLAKDPDASLSVTRSVATGAGNVAEGAVWAIADPSDKGEALHQHDSG